MFSPPGSGDLQDQGISQGRPRVVPVPPGQLDKFIKDPGLRLPRRSLIGEGFLLARSVNTGNHAATRRFSNEATYPATRRFSISQCAHWFASCPGHILTKSRLAALIPIGTRHGSALGRRHLTERRRADSRIDICRTSGPGIRKAPRPQRIRPSSCWAWAGPTGHGGNPNARNNQEAQTGTWRDGRS